ncbi:LptF/LptG family permease [Fervidobacterium thailandense]|uniref:Permease n=1 Tax=Fervidobacterium thailandense TaxID=1008305 RepID=A0A1E3G582_9BACT|nr:LptF/LptG family permease [Fervidobacterium thailandense]ODN31003.1 permease [Fervidobacterium thailandense]
MKTLTRYVLKLSLKPFLMGLAGFIVFVSVEWLYQISDYIIRNRVGIKTLFLFILYNLPYFTFLGIPVGVLFAIFWVISDLYNNREITALLVHGVPSKKLVTPFVILSIVLGFVSWLLGDYVVPVANYKSSQILYNYIFQSPEAVVKTNTLVELERDVYFYVKEYDKEKGELYDVVLFRNEEGNEQILTSKKVLKKKDGWYLLDGNMYIVELESGFLKLEMQFKEMKLDVAGEIEQMLKTSKTVRDKTSKELREQLMTYKKLGINTSNLVVELQQRYANAVGAFVIVLIGLPVSLLFGFKSRSWGVITTFVIIVLYQGSGAWLSGLGKEGMMDPVLAVWLPNIVFASMGLVMYILVDTPVAFRIREFLTRLFVILVFVAILGGQTVVYGRSVNVTANEILLKENQAVLSGSVKITWDKYRLETDVATATLLDGKVKLIEASGNAVFTFDDQKYIAKYVSYEFETERPLVLNAKTVYKYDYQGRKVPIYAYSAKIEYDKNTETSELLDSYVTTCDFEEPHYKVVAARITVLENKYIIAQNAFLFVLGVPLFPYPIFVTALEGKPPYAFSVVFGNKLGVNHSFAFKVDPWAVELELNSSGAVEFNARDTTQGSKNRVVYSDSKKVFEFTLVPLTYRHVLNTGATYFKIEGPTYFEGNYVSDTNFQYKAGFNFSSPDGRLYMSPSLTYNGTAKNSTLVLSGGLKSLSFPLPLENSLSISSIDLSLIARTEGYPSLVGKEWTTSLQNTYNLSLSNKSFNVSSSLQGRIVDGNLNQTFSYTYQLPWNQTIGPFSLAFQYTFSMRNTLNVVGDKRAELFALTDRYVAEARYSFGPLSISAKWTQAYAFLEEPQTTNTNTISGTLAFNTPTVSLSVTRGWDVLKGTPSPETYALKFSPDIGPVNLSASMNFNYDPKAGKIGPQNISASASWKEIQTSYSLNYVLTPGVFPSQIVHTLKYTTFTLTVTQRQEFISSVVGTGSFTLFDYKNTVNLTYSQTSKDTPGSLRGTYTVEKPGEKYSLSYNVGGKDLLTLGVELKNIDPQVSVSLSYNLATNLPQTLKLTLDKSLHCWRATFGLDLSYKTYGGLLDYIDKVFIKFYLTDIPDRYFQYDSELGMFQVGGM